MLENFAFGVAHLHQEFPLHHGYKGLVDF